MVDADVEEATAFFGWGDVEEPVEPVMVRAGASWRRMSHDFSPW